MRIARTRTFRTDAASAYAFIAKRDVAAAERLLDRIEEACAPLAVFPESAPTVPGLAAGLRGKPLRGFPYRLFYRIDGDLIVLLRLLHGRRNTDAGWFKEEE